MNRELNSALPRTIGVVLAGALVASGAAFASAGPAQAASAEKIAKVKIAETPKSVTVPYGTSSSTDVAVKVTFNGAAADPGDSNGDKITVTYAPTDAKGNGATIKKAASRVKSPTAPTVVGSPSATNLAPGVAQTYTFRVVTATTPGRYTLSVPITQTIVDGNTGKTTKTTKVGKASFNVTANTSYSVDNSDLVSMHGYLGKKFSVKITAPTYTYGAKATVYFRASSASKFTAVGSGKVNKSGVASFKTKKGRIRTSGTVYFKVGAISYSPSYSVGYWSLTTA